MSLRITKAQPLLAIALVLAVGACTNRPTTSAVSDFSVALEGASTSVRQGLSEVQRLETAVHDTDAAERFVFVDKAPLILNANRNITDAVIKPRLDFFVALSKYASSLSTAVSEDQVEKARAQFQATGEAFQELGVTVFEASKVRLSNGTAGSAFPADLAGQISTAVSGLGAFLIEQKLNREIPKIVAGAHVHLKKGVDAFKKDLGDPSNGIGGFRSILNDSIEILQGNRQDFLIMLRDDGVVPKGELYNAVLASQVEFRELRNSERLLAEIPEALDKMLEAHKALETPEDQSALDKVQVFFERAQVLQGIVQALRS